VYLRKDEYTKAINCFELATAVNDDFANAWYNTGLAYSKINQYSESRKAFLKAFELDPFDYLVPLNIAQSYEATGDYASAIKYFLETLKISKSSIDAYVGLGNCYTKINNYSKMLHSFSMIIKYSLLENFNEDYPNNLIDKLNTIYSKICI